MRAELLQLTGQNRDARRIVQRIARTKPAVSLKARCELILGQICLEEEEPALSIRHFQKAVKLAANVGEMELLCHAQAKLLTTLADISTPSAVLALLREAEKNVAAFGDAHSAADFHLRVAQIEATRGEFKLTKAHLRTARTMLQVEPNQWLEGSLNLAASAVHFLTSELELALQYALDALRCAVESGHARTRMAATANLGLLQLHLGRADQAEVHINEALELSEKFSVSRISLLDSYAQLQLIRGRNHDCGRVLREMEEEVSIHEPSVVSWQQMAVGSTRLRWLLAGHDWINAHELAVEMIQAADGKSDRPHQVSFRVLGADALIALGRLDEADTLINEVADFAEDVPIALFAEVERVRASLLASTVGTEAARQPFERSLRVLSALAGVAPRMDAARSYQRTMRPANDGLRRQLEAEPWDLNPLIQSSLPSSTSRHKESVHPMERASPRIDIGAAEMLDRLVSKPDLLAQEAFILLRESGHASALAIVERKKGRLERVVARAGWSIDQARRAASGSNDTVRVLVGTANDVLLEVVASPRDNPQARAYMLYFKSLLQRSRELKSFRDTERAQFSLMTPEASSGEDAGVFVAENMRQLMAAAKQMAKTTENILIVGETGTGKEVVARLIHKWSDRSAQDFVSVQLHRGPRGPGRESALRSSSRRVHRCTGRLARCRPGSKRGDASARRDWRSQA